jgi:hypothetical protein
MPLFSDAFIAMARTLTGTPRTVHRASAASDEFAAPRDFGGRPTRLAGVVAVFLSAMMSAICVCQSRRVCRSRQTEGCDSMVAETLTGLWCGAGKRHDERVAHQPVRALLSAFWVGREIAPNHINGLSNSRAICRPGRRLSTTFTTVCCGNRKTRGRSAKPAGAASLQNTPTPTASRRWRK